MKDKKKQSRKKTLHSLCVIAVAVVVIMIAVLALSTHKPWSYQPIAAPASSQANTYLMHDLVPAFYNNFQLGEPFEMIIEQDGFNRIIADGSLFGCDWPVDLSGVKFTAPAVAFAKDTIILMGTIDYAELPIVVTIFLEPAIDGDGMLDLNCRKVKAGLFNITSLARFIAGKVFAAQIKKNPQDRWLTGLSEAFLENKPLEPVFPSYSGKNVRVTSTEIQSRKLVLTFKPE